MSESTVKGGAELKKQGISIHSMRRLWRRPAAPVEVNEILVKLLNGQLIYVDNRDESVASPLIEFGWWEPSATSVFQRLITADSVVFDIGANLGYFGLVASRQVRCPDNLHLFEANPELIALMRKSFAANDLAQARIIQAIVSDRSGDKLTLRRVKNFWGGSSVEPLGQQPIDAEFVVETLSLDDYCRKNGIAKVDVVKIDVESHEEKVYAGMRQMIAANPQLKILMEYDIGAYSESFLPTIRRDFKFVRVIPNQYQWESAEEWQLAEIFSEQDIRQVVTVPGLRPMLLLENELTLPNIDSSRVKKFIRQGVAAMRRYKPAVSFYHRLFPLHLRLLLRRMRES
jgi:FkbM family methyltransferase